MSSNGVSSGEEPVTPCDGDNVVTMMDVLQEQQAFEEDANAVLGASDDKECTYNKGYIKRQALYACLTCCPDTKENPEKRAGVCLACSLACHENHDLIELYTKRNFRCDCGNPKFNGNSCQFTPIKTELNEENIYNQNFSGLYCVCSRPYPDPENNLDDEEMVQCIICEDWLHAAHLDANVPSAEVYAEMVCKGCMEKNEFLHDYTGLAVNDLESSIVDIVNVSTVTENGDVTKEKEELGSIVDVKTLADNLAEENEDKPVETPENSSEKLNDVPEEKEGTESVKETTEPTDDKPEEAATTDQTEDAADKKIKDNPPKDEESSDNKAESTEIIADKTETSTENTESAVKDTDKQEENAETPAESTETAEKVGDEKLESMDTSVDEKVNGDSTDSDKENLTNGNKRKLTDDEEVSVKKAKLDCKRPKGVSKTFKGATFWPSDFRAKLCTCTECTTMYKDLSVLYLIDLEDTVTAYEDLGKQKAESSPSQYEKGLAALSSLDRIQQINAMTEYNNMRDKLLDFLKSFKDRKEIVKEEDIKEFFAGIKPKQESDGVYFCR